MGGLMGEVGIWQGDLWGGAVDFDVPEGGSSLVLTATETGDGEAAGKPDSLFAGGEAPTLREVVEVARIEAELEAVPGFGIEAALGWR